MRCVSAKTGLKETLIVHDYLWSIRWAIRGNSTLIREGLVWAAELDAANHHVKRLICRYRGAPEYPGAPACEWCRASSRGGPQAESHRNSPDERRCSAPPFSEAWMLMRHLLFSRRSNSAVVDAAKVRPPNGRSDAVPHQPENVPRSLHNEASRIPGFQLHQRAGCF